MKPTVRLSPVTFIGAGKVKTAGITRQALILVGEVLAARTVGVPNKSKLYDSGFSHGFREGQAS